MRKIFLGLIGVIISTVLFAQQNVPNNGFEAWDSSYLFEDLGFYNTSNAQSNTFAASPYVIKQTTSQHGLYSAKLTSYASMLGGTMPSFIFSGDINALLSGNFSGGFPYTQKPDSFIFYARYKTNHHDSILIVLIYKNSLLPTPGGLMGIDMFKLYGDESVNYKRCAFKTNCPLPPDSVILGIVSSNYFLMDSINEGNWIEIDNMSFTRKSGAKMSDLPNYDFENWKQSYYIEPQDWTTLNFFNLLMGGNASVEPTSPGHSGNLAAKITSQYMTLGGTPEPMGLLILGNTDGSGGMEILTKPDSINFWYKYNNAKAKKDSALAGIMFTKYNTKTQVVETIDSYIVALATSSTFKFTGFKFKNLASKQVDSMVVAFFSSNTNQPGTAGAGNYLIVDDITIHYPGVGIPVSYEKGKGFVYPNPAADKTNLRFFLDNKTENTLVNIYDLSGKMRLSQLYTKLPSGENNLSLDVSNLPSGEYFIGLVIDNNKSYQARFTKK